MKNRRAVERSGHTDGDQELGRGRRNEGIFVQSRDVRQSRKDGENEDLSRDFTREDENKYTDRGLCLQE